MPNASEFNETYGDLQIWSWSQSCIQIPKKVFMKPSFLHYSGRWEALPLDG